MGDGNTSSVIQSGVNGAAGDPDNIYGSADPLSLAGVVQNGSDNESTVFQSGDNTNALVNQSGTFNVASVNQAGNFANADIAQTGNSNNATVVRQSAHGTGDGSPASSPVV